MPNLPYSTSGWTSAIQQGKPRLRFPFPDDPTIFLVERTYTVPLANYSAPTMGTADATYATHYLAAQTDLEPLDAGLVRYTRIFAPVPSTRYDYLTQLFPRPSLHDVVVSGVYGVSFDEGLTSHLFFSRIAVSAVGAITAAQVKKSLAAEAVTDFSAGTFSLTDTSGATYSPAFTSSAASIWSTLSASAATGLTVTKGIGTLTISWTGGVRNIGTTQAGVRIEGSVGSGSVTFRVGTAAVTDAETEIISPPTRTLTTTAAHGGSAGAWMAAWNNDKLVGIVKPTAASGSSITIPCDEAPWNINGLAITHVAFAPAALRLVNGARDCSVRSSRKFYLPGVTAGITTAADIPGATLYADPIGWLGRILATQLTSVTATASNDRLTKTSHGLSTGDAFLLTSIGSGAAGLTAPSLYFAIRVDADNFKAATSPDNAIAGTAIDITSDGTSLSLYVPSQYAAIATDELVRWQGTTVFTKAITEIQMADALESRSASA